LNWLSSDALVSVGFVCESFLQPWNTIHEYYARLEEITSVVRQTGDSRHNGDAIEGQPLNPSIRQWCDGPRGFKGSSIGPHDAERRRSLGQQYVWSLLFFQSGQNVRQGYLKQSWMARFAFQNLPKICLNKFVKVPFHPG